MSAFDAYICVDWSAAGVPKTGADSIWIAYLPVNGDLTLTNPSTRAEAIEHLSGYLQAGRAFVGFDFPFGYPVGFSKEFGGWQGVWAHFAEYLEDGIDNANDRFDLAASINSRFPGGGPFWGNALKRDIPDLSRTKPDGYGLGMPEQKRACEKLTSSAQETWKLSGIGSVGGQALTGIARLEKLRKVHNATIWPFEAERDGAHVFAEVYPSLIPPHKGEAIKDAGQVRAMAHTFRGLDRDGALQAMLKHPRTLGQDVVAEEGWILGVEAPEVLKSVLPIPRPLTYERDPSAIYAQSFATVASEARLERFPEDLHPLITRLIHACGMVDVADRVAFSNDAVASGQAAMATGAPVLCDCEMVRSGITRKLLPAENPILCTLNDEDTPRRAKTLATTRSAAAVEAWRDSVEGAVIAIGNAPTSLFHLLERLDEGWPKPAVILGFPVGFVGAAESKAELAAYSRGVPFVTLRGRRGGSAMASAAVNALAAGLKGAA